MAYGKIKADTLVFDNSGSDVELAISTIATGSLSNYALLAGATFTGGITGTTAGFTGDVGIGTSSPDNLLHLSASNSGIGADFTLGRNILRFEDTDVTQSNNQFTGGIVFEGHDSDSGAAGLQAAITCNAASSGGNGGSQFRFYTTAGGSRINGSSTPSMVIDSSGRVGIGTLSPSKNIEIRTDANDEGILLKSTGSTSNALDFDANRGGAGNGLASIRGKWNGTTVAQIGFLAGSDTTNKDDGVITFGTESAASNGNANATERMRIDSSGRLLVGTSSAPAGTDAQYSKFAIRGNTINDNACYLSLGNKKTTANTTSDDNLGIITFNDSDTDAGEYARIVGATDGANGTNDYPGKLVFLTTADGASIPTERMRITSSGRVLIAKSASNFANVGIELRENGEVVVTRSGGDVITTRRLVSEGTHFSLRNISGTSVGTIVTTSSSTTYNTSSDYRLKENVVDIADGITRVKQLQPRRFNFIADDTTTVDGFIAHEAQTVVPEAVTGEKDGEEMQGIDQSKLVPLLTAALQEAIAKIETLEAKVTALEGV